MNTMVYGNLALAPREDAPGLRVVQGGCARMVVAPAHQIAAPDCYARPCTRSSSRLSILRAVCGVSALVLALGAFSLGLSEVRAARRSAALSETARMEVLVAHGASLWELASQHAIAGLDTSETVEVIKEWNDLDGSMLHAGMELTVPGNAS